MTDACADPSGGAMPRSAAASRAANKLALAASPTFGLMALFTGALSGGSADMMLCASAQSSPLSGMAAMYLLMSAFHTAPWLKLISNTRGRAAVAP
jgi:hypothetical protein